MGQLSTSSRDKKSIGTRIRIRIWSGLSKRTNVLETQHKWIGALEFMYKFTADIILQISCLTSHLQSISYADVQVHMRYDSCDIVYEIGIFIIDLWYHIIQNQDHRSTIFWSSGFKDGTTTVISIFTSYMISLFSTKIPDVDYHAGVPAWVPKQLLQSWWPAHFGTWLRGILAGWHRVSQWLGSSFKLQVSNSPSVISRVGKLTVPDS